eukprot:evm.model.scf_59.8 EVM.evm.TU.scf_59.8   scf_59:56777-57088(-)
MLTGWLTSCGKWQQHGNMKKRAKMIRGVHKMAIPAWCLELSPSSHWTCSRWYPEFALRDFTGGHRCRHSSETEKGSHRPHWVRASDQGNHPDAMPHMHMAHAT